MDNDGMMCRDKAGDSALCGAPGGTARRESLSRLVSALSDAASVRFPFAGGGEGAPLPTHEAVGRIIALCRELVFPGYFGAPQVAPHNLTFHTGIAAEALHTLLCGQIAAGLAAERSAGSGLEEAAGEKALQFMKGLPRLRGILADDAMATYLGDPAATSVEEVIYCYPGLRATVNHRIAHSLLRLGVPVIPRMISEQAHRETGIDIHPGASIGERFVIDHGTGVVIGATAIIGNDVKIYQGVTLGARSFARDCDNNPVKGIARHPIVGDGVVIYSNTTVLGRITIGAGAVIGGNLWITEDVPAGEKLVQARPDNFLRFKQ